MSGEIIFGILITFFDVILILFILRSYYQRIIFDL